MLKYSTMACVGEAKNSAAEAKISICQSAYPAPNR